MSYQIDSETSKKLEKINNQRLSGQELSKITSQKA